MHVQSKRFDTLEVGDVIDVLGLRHVVVVTHGETTFDGISSVYVIPEGTEFSAELVTSITFPSNRFVDCRSETVGSTQTPTGKTIAHTALSLIHLMAGVFGYTDYKIVYTLA